MNLNKIILITIFILAIIPRGIELFGTSHYFGNEQGIEYLVTKSIAVDHKSVLTAHQGGLGGFSKPAGFNYLLLIPYIFTNGHPFGGRVFMFAISVLTVFLAFFTTKKIFNAKTALFITFFISISSALSHYAGRISPPFIIPILTVCLVYTIFKIFKGQYKYFIIATCIAGLMVNFETATSAVIALEIFILLVIYIVKRKTSYWYFIFYFLILVGFLSPLFINDLIFNSENFKGIIKLFSVVGQNNQSLHMSNIQEIINNRFSVFSWNFYSTFTPRNLVSIPLLLFMFLGSIFYIKDKKNLFEHRLLVIFLTISPLFTFIFLLFYPDNIVQWWIIQLSIFYCYLAGIIAAYSWKKKKFRILTFLLILILLLAFTSRTYSLFKREFAYSRNLYITESEPIEYIYKDAKGMPFSILVYAPNPLENYEYLIWWYGNNKYHYFPTNNKKVTSLYIIVEDPTPHNLKKIKSLNKGVIVDSKNIGGFLVQKRIL